MVKAEKLEHSAESKIFEAARMEFIERGFDGARMQRIAENAGINKSLLHYYYRSKENLFQKIFMDAFDKLFPMVLSELDSKKPLPEKVKILVDKYMDFLIENPFIPLFILNELNRNADLIENFFHSKGFNPQMLLGKIAEEFKKDNITHIQPHHLLITILSLCIFPVLAKPMISKIMLSSSPELQQNFLKERKEIIYPIIINMLKRPEK